MRTKHVLMTTALMALFAACSNEEFLDNAQSVPGGVDNQRPTVENVTLNLVGEDGAATRLGFTKEEGYEWGEGDVIGALLMDDWNDSKLGVNGDRPSTVSAKKWNEYTWTQRYVLSDQIHTDYPFRRKDDGTWSCEAKMQEGNYFFAFPFATYEGKREALHDLSIQEQHGTTPEALQAAYADNQFFIGYARIKAGVESTDVISADLQMTPVLGAVGITIKNESTGSYTVKKIVLESADFNTVIKIDPTNALYQGKNGEVKDGYNVNTELAGWTPANYFNYANYTEMTFANKTWSYNDQFTERYSSLGQLVNNTEKSDNYDRDNALRATINPVEGCDHRAELTVYDAPVLKPQDSAEFLIMTNIYKYDEKKGNHITAYVYTDQGMMKGVIISKFNSELVDKDKVSVITDNPITEISPEKPGSVTLKIDGNSIQEPNQMNVYNEEDLVQLIEWNKNMRRPFTATLMNDVTLTKEMSENLVSEDWKDARMVVENAENMDNMLTIEGGAAANILDKIIVNTDVEIKNNLTLGSESYVNGKYTGITGSDNQPISAKNQNLYIAEGATVTVNSAIEWDNNKEGKVLNVTENEGTLTINAEVEQLAVENKGELNINAEVTVYNLASNEANATVTVGEKGILRAGGNFTNKGQRVGNDAEEYAVIYNNGQIYNLKNNKYGKIYVGAGAGVITNVDNNDGIIDITNNINANFTKVGTISFTAKAKTALLDVIKAGVTELIVDGGSIEGVAVTNSNSQATAEATYVKNVIVKENGGTIGTAAYDANGKRVYWDTQFPNADIEINGNVTLTDMLIGGNIFDIKAGTTTIKGTVDAQKSTVTIASYDDKKYVAHAASLFIPSNKDVFKADALDKSENPKAGVAKVNNQGTVYLNEKGLICYGDNWAGNDPKDYPATPDTNYAPETLTISGGTLADVKAQYDDFSKVTKIEINTQIDMKEKANLDNIDLLQGKDIELSADLKNIPADKNLVVKSVTLKSNVAISGVTRGKTFIKVDALNIGANKLTVVNGYLEINNWIAQAGTQCGAITWDSNNKDPYGKAEAEVVAKNNAGEYLWYHFAGKSWKEF